MGRDSLLTVVSRYFFFYAHCIFQHLLRLKSLVGEGPLKSKSGKMMHTYANNRQKRKDVSRILIGSVIAISCKISDDPNIS